MRNIGTCDRRERVEGWEEGRKGNLKEKGRSHYNFVNCFLEKLSKICVEKEVGGEGKESVRVKSR